MWLLVANRPGGSSSPVKDAVATVAAETVEYRYILYFIYLLAAFERKIFGRGFRSPMDGKSMEKALTTLLRTIRAVL